jgi:hypothetical protein
MVKGPSTASPILPTYCLFLLIKRRVQLASRLYEDGQEGKAFWQERFYDFSVYRSGKAGGSAFIPGWPTVCALVSCKRWVTLLRFCPIYSLPTIHYSLASYGFADRLERTQTQDPPSKPEDGAPSA